jgi:hypothetical protein
VDLPAQVCGWSLSAVREVRKDQGEMMVETPSGPNDYRRMMDEVFTAERVLLYTQGLSSEFPALSRNARFSSHLDSVGHNLVLTMQSWMWAGRVPTNEQTERLEYCDSVWQLWKQKFAPSWIKKRWPVKRVSVETSRQTNHYFVCPHLVFDNQSTHIKFMATGTRQASKIL